MKTTKKLILTISDDSRKEQKMTILHFLDTLDPMSFSDHLDSLPGLDQLITKQLSQSSSAYCKHAHYIEKNNFAIFRQDS